MPHDRYDDWVGSPDAWEEDLYAEEYEHEYPLLRLRAFLSEILSRILPARCPDCGRFYIFSKGDHDDCLPF